MTIAISRVSELPVTPAANTIYLVSEGVDRVRVVVTGASGAVVRSSAGWAETQTAITDAISSAQSTLASAITDGDAATLSTLRGELASEVAATLTAAAATADTKIAAAIAGLDMTNAAEFCANIAARDALEPTKNIFALVEDASGDATVDTGSALYFYNSATDTWVKVAEYESMDVIFPNKAFVEKFSEVGGVLHYDGAPVGTVIAGVTEW